MRGTPYCLAAAFTEMLLSFTALKAAIKLSLLYCRRFFTILPSEVLDKSVSAFDDEGKYDDSFLVVVFLDLEDFLVFDF